MRSRGKGERRARVAEDGPQGTPSVSTEWYFMAFDSIFLCIYVVEAVLKIIALGLKYFSDSWNNLGVCIWGWGQ